MKKRKTQQFFLPLLTLLALAWAVPLLTFNHRVAAVQSNTGSVNTTSSGCTQQNGNTAYKMKSDVWLSGANFPDGNYYVRVTPPHDNVVLGKTLTASVAVTNGVFPCVQLTAILYTATSGFTSSGYDDTPNMGGEYKVWVSLDSNFESAKTDNFKVKEGHGLIQSAIGGVKYYDPNADGTLNPGETTGVAGVTIKVTFNNGPMAGTMVTTETGPAGEWGLVFPETTNITVCEVPSLNTPYTQTGPVSGAKSADMLFTADNKCWTGVVSALDTGDLNFFNTICQPVIACPANIEATADSNCQATVTYTTPTATDNCSGLVPYVAPSVSCTPLSGSTFALGTTTVTCTALDGVNSVNTASCTFTVTVKDKTGPTLNVPDKVDVCTPAVSNGLCSAAATYAVSATDNCDNASAITISCSPASGSTFPLGTTTVTCTATDSHMNQSTKSFPVTVKDCSVGAISGKKIYDANGDWSGNIGSQVVKGYKVVLSGATSATAYTDANGMYSFANLGPGTYTVTEVAPNTSWVATKAASYTFTVSCRNSNVLNNPTYDFCNYCKTPSGGLTLGFWSNNNGKALTTAVDLCYLNSLPLKNANGSDFDPVPASACLNPASPTLTTTQINNGKTAFGNWLTGANASNMANMLSAQLAAMEMNVRKGKVSGSAYTLCFNGTVNDLMVAARASLTANPNTTASGPIRTYQESLKTCLDGLNNGGAVVSGGPCPFTSPY